MLRLSVLAAALCVVAAFASDANAQRNPNRGNVAAPLGQSTQARRHLDDVRVPPTTTRVEPRFLVKATRFYVADESGWDIPYTSDETYAEFWDRTSGDRLYTSIFDDVDSGEWRDFAGNQSCMFPLGQRLEIRDGFPSRWYCNNAGRGGGINLRVTFYDDDRGQPAACGTAPGVRYNPYGCQNTVLGAGNIRYGEAALVGLMPHVGDVHEDEVRLGGYTFYYRIERVADATVRENNFVNAPN